MFQRLPALFTCCIPGGAPAPPDLTRSWPLGSRSGETAYKSLEPKTHCLLTAVLPRRMGQRSAALYVCHVLSPTLSSFCPSSQVTGTSSSQKPNTPGCQLPRVPSHAASDKCASHLYRLRSSTAKTMRKHRLQADRCYRCHLDWQINTRGP